MEIKEMLKEAGLTGNESKVYLELLKKEESIANKIAKNLSLDRTLTYTILNHLIDKGLVSYKIKDKIKYFQAENPEFILENQKKKEILLSSLVEKLKEIKKLEENETEVRVYEGIEGLRALSKIMMKSKHLDAFGATGRLYNLLYEAAPLVREMTRKGHTSRILLPKEIKGHEFTKHQGIKTKVFEIKSEATTTIFGDYVAIHLIKDKPLAILIKNKDIAESYRSYFDKIWSLV